MDLGGRIAVITGAGGSIGRDLALAFRGGGARVAGCDTTLAMMEDMELDFRVAFDITDAAATEAAVARIEGELGPVAMLVNNAGWSRAETMDHLTDASWEREVAINLTGSRNVTDRVLKGMRQRKAGSIVFISSVNALAHFGNPAYSAAKAGLLAYSRAIAVEYGRDGIRSNCVCPGSVITKAWDHRIAADPGLVPKVEAFYPMGRTVTAAEVASTTLFLASDQASGVTGTALAVDAGLTAGNMVFLDSILR